MVELKERYYKLLLCDTNIISGFLKDKKAIGKGLIELMLKKDYLLCITFTGIAELYKCDDLFDEFFNYLSIIPFFVLKNFNQLLNEEIDNYPLNNKVDPICFSFKALEKKEYYSQCKGLFYTEPIKTRLIKENDIEVKKDTLKAVLSWIKGYPKPINGFTKKDIELWVELVLYKRLVEVNRPFLEQNKKLDYNYFLSWKMIAYLTFYKFYLNNKRPTISDLGDILMSANFPYVDAIVVEKNVKEIVRQIQNKHNFVRHLELFDINCFY